MKILISLCTAILFLLIPQLLIAQNGGFNTGNLNVSNTLQVGTASEAVLIHSEMISLPPLTDSEIQNMGGIPEGSLIYGSDSDVLLFYNGTEWKRVDSGSNQANTTCYGRYTDQDGNDFLGVLIGDQCWMDRNLAVTTYPNGEPITHISDNSQWGNLNDTNTASDAAYCYYDNDSLLGYGGLYTYAAAIACNWSKDNTEGQGICPDGWHLPTDAEWTDLENWLAANGHSGEEGNALKSMFMWDASETETDNYGFTALPGGIRNYDNGSFLLAGVDGRWWSATEIYSDNAWFQTLSFYNADLYRIYENKSTGYSVRCVRDSN